ncbi:MAG: hypothetical protein CL609_11720 [Anaerolineaceae bacterium]|nr:hypothetical protein [Anaerolineaceae bacterium]
MRTVRRIYFYLVTFISLQVVLWGSINLLYSFIRNDPNTDFNDVLAQGLAQIVVGLPIFFFHWYFIRKDAATQLEERDSYIRALFFYALRLTSLVIVIIHTYSVVQNLLFNLIQIPLGQRFFFPTNDFAKNLITIAANLLIWYLFERILRKNWQPKDAQQDFTALKQFRLLFNYLWSSFHLLFWVIGLTNILLYIIAIPRGFNQQFIVEFANGLSMVLISAPFWILAERKINESLTDPEHNQSLIRKIFTYLSLLIFIGIALVTLGTVLRELGLLLFRDIDTWADFIRRNQQLMAISLIAFFLWFYFQLKIKQVFASARDDEERASLKRIISYILSLAGTATTYSGVWFVFQLLTILITSTNRTQWRSDLSTAIALLVIGIPLWLYYWLPVQRETNQANEVGDDNRRSIIRKIYLYLIVFATVIGVMALAAALVYRNLNQFFGNPQTDLVYENINNIFRILITSAWLWLHLKQLRRDGQLANQVIQNRHKSFPVLILENETDSIAQQWVELFKKHAPFIPIQTLNFNDQPIVEGENQVALLLMTAADYHQSSPVWRGWIESFSGKIILLPLDYDHVHWSGVETQQRHKLMELAVKQTIQFAETEKTSTTHRNSIWAVLGYVLIGLILIWLVFGVGLSFIR